MKMTQRHCWIWPKSRNFNCVNLTENWQWQTCSCWTWPIMIEFDQNSEILSIFGFRSYSLVHVCHCGDIYRIFGFRSNSTQNVHRYGKYKLLFWSSSQSERSLLSVFGHVHRFQSYSFGHLHLVKLTTLISFIYNSA